MKMHLKNIILPAATLLLASAMTGCLKEAFPEDDSASAEQIAGADKTALVAAMPAYLNAGGDEAWDIGFSGFQIFWDAMTEDYPVYSDNYDYFRYFNTQLSIGNNGVSQTFWVRYYYLLQKANSVIAICDTDPHSSDAVSMGEALVFRSMVYLDLARMFEYKRTRIARLDDIADERGAWGLTVPVITEKTTEAESRVLPRAPFYEMYRFINNDLLNAEKYLRDTHSVEDKTLPCLGVAYGLHARLWLEMGSRFELYPEDLAKQIENESALEQYEKLGITSANDCFRKAAEYARKAIGEGFTPVSRNQWFDTSSGFNAPNNSWLWALTVSPNLAIATSDWKSIPSFKSPEANYGMSNSTYGCTRMIDARLFGKIDANDWRRATWIDPEFVDMADGDEKVEEFNATYSSVTVFNYDTFCDYPAYSGFKFRPASGNCDSPVIGNLVSLPLMRIEEMYLIEAEALAHCDGPAAGKAAIEDFMNSYRMNEGTTFTCNASSLEDVVDVIWTQKRVELWGEGQVYWDYKRRELAIERGYPGTNHPAIYRYNSNSGAVAPWTNFYIPDRVQNLNQSIVLNPDPNMAISTLWE